MVTGKKTNTNWNIHSIQDPSSSSLAILVESNQLTFTVTPLHKENSSIIFKVAYSDYDEFSTLFGKKGSDFAQVIVFVESEEVTLVPDGLYDPKAQSDYLDGVFGPSKKIITSNLIDKLGLHTVFRFESAVHQAIEKNFPQATIHHLSEVLLLKTWIDRSFADEMLVRIHLQGNRLFVLGFKGKSLCSFNQFVIGDATDVVYHTLNTIEESKSDYTSTALVCSGNMSGQEESFLLLQSYCPQLSYIKASQFDLEFQEQYILSNQQFCAL